jgi:hypothetical protein
LDLKSKIRTLGEKEMRKTRIMLILTITLATLFIPTAMQVSATPWSASNTSVEDLDFWTGGLTKGFKDNGQIGGYRTWSAYASGGLFHWGEVRVWITSGTITSDTAGDYEVEFKTYFDGKITVGVQNRNVWLKITYQLKQGSTVIFSTLDKYDTAQTWVGSVITHSEPVVLSANTNYHVYVYYRYYCGVATAGNHVDFYEHGTEYHQWRGWTLHHD